MSARVVLYLYKTRDIQLVLGGTDPLQIITATDATLNTAPQGRSVIAICTRLGPNAGMVSAKCRATIDVVLSSFESEIHGVDRGIEQNTTTRLCVTSVTEAVKQAAGVHNMLMEMGDGVSVTTTILSDNEAMVNFVNGKGQAKGIKHALLRLWYLREQIAKGVSLLWVKGDTIVANAMTKAVHRHEHEKYRQDVQGYNLLSTGRIGNASVQL